MALSTPTALGTFQSGINHGTGAFSNSITTVNNSLLVVMVVASLTTATATNFENNLTVSGGGLTYTPQAHNRAVYESTFTFGVRIFTAPVTTGATFNLDVDAGALESYAYKVYVAYYTGHDTSSPVGATASFSEIPVSGAISGSLSGAPASTSDVIAVLGCLSESLNVNVGSGWTELVDPSYVTDSFMEWQTQRRSGSTSTTVEWAGLSASSDGAHAAAIEVKEAAGGGGTTDAALTAAGTGVLAGAARVAAAPAGTLTGLGQLNGTARSTASPAGALTGLGQLNGTARVAASSALTAAGTGTLNGVARVAAATVGTASGVGTLAAVGASSASVAALAAGTGTLNGTAQAAAASALTATGLGQLNGAATSVGGSESTLTATGAGTLIAIAAAVASVIADMAGSGALTGAAEGGLEEQPADQEIDLGGAGAGAYMHPDQLLKRKKKREPRRYVIDLNDKEATMYGKPMSEADARKYEQEMQAECDLRTLAEAERIKSDPSRMRRLQDKLTKAQETLDNLKTD